MAIYAIGDVQGCYDELMRMLDLVKFDPTKDQIWLAGDIVNRGPKSAEVIRFAMQQGEEVVKVVLGNHDLHLLAYSVGVTKHHHFMDTLESVLKAEDSDELLFWLRHQPLFYHDEEIGFSMVHAGLPPKWTIKKALKRAKEVETVLQSENWQAFVSNMYGNQPNRWSKGLEGWDRLRYITNCFTRLRYCHDDGRLALKFKGPPINKPLGQKPWFEMPGRRSQADKIVFGHWSALGTGRYDNVFSLDSGVVWGEQLTAVRIDSPPYRWFVIEADPAGLPHAKNSVRKSLKSEQAEKV
jgi:bis(5'-nucleosyl)-tetraphosphatase (symmetrical)